MKSSMYDIDRTLQRGDHVELAVFLAEAILNKVLSCNQLQMSPDSERWHQYAVRYPTPDASKPGREVLVSFLIESKKFEFRTDVRRDHALAMAMDLSGQWSSEDGCPHTVTLTHAEAIGIVDLARAHLLYGRKRS